MKKLSIESREFEITKEQFDHLRGVVKESVETYYNKPDSYNKDSCIWHVSYIVDSGELAIYLLDPKHKDQYMTNYAEPQPEITKIINLIESIEEKRIGLIFHIFYKQQDFTRVKICSFTI